MPRMAAGRHRRIVPVRLESRPGQYGKCPGMPMTTPARRRQHVRYVNGKDGTRLAWAESGTGPLLVKAANWLTHLEYEWDSPVWKHWIEFLSANHRFVRYDERGCGMSQWPGSAALGLEHWVGDLESVIGAARPTEPFTLLGISQGS